MSKLFFGSFAAFLLVAATALAQDPLDQDAPLGNPDPAGVEVDPAEPTDPFDDPADPLSDPADPLSDPADPLSDPADPLSDPADPLSDPADPLSDPADPAATADSHAGHEHAAHAAAKLPNTAVAALYPTKIGDQTRGVVLLYQREGFVEFVGKVVGLEPGPHGFHIHEFGDLRSDNGESAGDHYNPEGHQHGAPDAAERHMGDLGNIEANQDGEATFRIESKGLSLHLVLGRSLVVHAGPDDFTTQPSGDSGDRIAVGVIGVMNKEFSQDGAADATEATDASATPTEPTPVEETPLDRPDDRVVDPAEPATDTLPSDPADAQPAPPPAEGQDNVPPQDDSGAETDPSATPEDETGPSGDSPADPQPVDQP